MILTALSHLVCLFIDKLWVVSLPNFPTWAMDAFGTAKTYLLQGCGFLQALFGSQMYAYLCALFWLSVTVHVAFMSYDLIMWILKKIPMASVQK